MINNQRLNILSSSKGSESGSGTKEYISQSWITISSSIDAHILGLISSLNDGISVLNIVFILLITLEYDGSLMNCSALTSLILKKLN